MFQSLNTSALSCASTTVTIPNMNNTRMKTHTLKNATQQTLADYFDGLVGDMFTQHTRWLFLLSPNTNLKGANAQ